MFSKVMTALFETLEMTIIAGFIGITIGSIIAMYLYHSNTLPKTKRQRIIILFTNLVLDCVRATPFIILLIALIPLTRLMVGTSIGPIAASVPLAIGAIPLFARLMYQNLTTLPPHLIQYVKNWSFSTKTYYIYIQEPRALHIRSIGFLWITLIGYSTMAGVVGGGGLGSLAYHYGYLRFDTALMAITVLTILGLVYAIQWSSEKLAIHYHH